MDTGPNPLGFKGSDRNAELRAVNFSALQLNGQSTMSLLGTRRRDEAVASVSQKKPPLLLRSMLHLLLLIISMKPCLEDPHVAC